MPLSPASMVHALLAALLIAAAVVDLRTRRIPNPLIAASLACGYLERHITKRPEIAIRRRIDLTANDPPYE